MKKILTATLLITASMNVNAALTSVLGGKAIYDDVADLTWLTDANYAYTSGYSAANLNAIGNDTNAVNADGAMGWDAATTWATNLNIDGVTGWRLPTSDGACTNYSCTGSEMGNLFHNVLGGSLSVAISASHNSNYDLFTNIVSGPGTSLHWSSTELDLNTAWFYDVLYGSQLSNNKIGVIYAWAVQSGNVSAVPVPAAIWLFGSGLIGLVGVSRRKS